MFLYGGSNPQSEVDQADAESAEWLLLQGSMPLFDPSSKSQLFKIPIQKRRRPVGGDERLEPAGTILVPIPNPVPVATDPAGVENKE